MERELTLQEKLALPHNMEKVTEMLEQTAKQNELEQARNAKENEDERVLGRFVGSIESKVLNGIEFGISFPTLKQKVLALELLRVKVTTADVLAMSLMEQYTMQLCMLTAVLHFKDKSGYRPANEKDIDFLFENLAMETVDYLIKNYWEGESAEMGKPKVTKSPR